MIVLVLVLLLVSDIMNRDKYFDEIVEYIPEGASVLDFGAGHCELSTYIGTRNPVTSVDIHKSCAGSDVYDGYRLPYEDDAFDVVVSMFVLHHIPHHEAIIKELQRVARKRLVVVEDAPESTYQRLVAMIHYLFFHQSVRMIEHMKSPEEWCAALGGRCTIKRLASRSFLNPTPHYVIVSTYTGLSVPTNRSPMRTMSLTNRERTKMTENSMFFLES